MTIEYGRICTTSERIEEMARLLASSFSEYDPIIDRIPCHKEYNLLEQIVHLFQHIRSKTDVLVIQEYFRSRNVRGYNDSRFTIPELEESEMLIVRNHYGYIKVPEQAEPILEIYETPSTPVIQLNGTQKLRVSHEYLVTLEEYLKEEISDGVNLSSMLESLSFDFGKFRPNAYVKYTIPIQLLPSHEVVLEHLQKR